MANRLAYCKSNGFILEANPDKQNKTVKFLKWLEVKKCKNLVMNGKKLTSI